GERRGATRSRSRARARPQGEGARGGGRASRAEKKTPGDLGGRGRRHGPEERRMIRTLLEEAVTAGARRWRACEVLGLTVRTVERWGDIYDDGRHGPNTVPANKLSETERKKLIAIATSPEFRDHSPSQIVPRLADRGEDVASESKFYLLLRDTDMQ